MVEQELNGPQISARFNAIYGECVPKRMRVDMCFLAASSASCLGTAIPSTERLSSSCAAPPAAGQEHAAAFRPGFLMPSTKRLRSTKTVSGQNAAMLDPCAEQYDRFCRF
jgi:hypothetical protein